MKKLATDTPIRSAKYFATAFVVAVLFAMLSPSRAVALPLLEKSYTMTADYIMFDIDKKVAYCEGRAEMTYGLMRIQAQKLRVDTHTHVLYAEGKVTIETMAQRTLRESAEESRTQGKADVPTVDVSNIIGNKQTSDDQAQQVDASIRQSNIQTFGGDVLIFDLVNYAGVIIKTNEEVSKTYLLGETLDVVARMPSMTAPEYLFDEPDIMTNAWTAKRLRINPGNLFESWQTMMWFKGNKVIPAAIPYYTNSPKGFTPGNLRLKTVHYSSNNNWNIGTLYKYSKSKNGAGSVSLDYSGKEGQTYTANLSQAFKLTRNFAGTVGLGNLFSSNGAYTMSLNRNMGGAKFQSFNSTISKSGSQYLSMNDNRNLFGQRMTSSLTYSGDNQDGYKSASTRMLMSLTNKTRYLGGGKKLGMRMNTSLAYNKLAAMSPDSNFFVGVSMFRSAKKLDRRSSLSSSFNVGYGMHSIGYDNDSYSTAINLNRNVGKSKSLGLSYKIGQNTSNGLPVATQYTSLSYSWAKTKDFNMALSTSLNNRTNSLGTIATNMSYKVNNRFTIWNDLIYDVKATRFNMKNYRMRYNLFGSDINAAWFAESNDFSVDLSSHF